MPLKRIKREYEKMIAEPSDLYAAQPVSDENLFQWVNIIYGPKCSPYEGGEFYLDMQLPTDYPFKPPKVSFSTPVYHPNINRQGCMSVDILCYNWSPALTIHKVLIHLHSLLSEPCPDDSIVPEIARIYKTDRIKYNKLAKEWTDKYATIPI